MNKTAIIVAGGSGNRMQSDIPKQFLPLNKIPVLMRTINLFVDYSPDCKIIVTTPENYVMHWIAMCKSFNFKYEHSIVIGGETRFESVQNALKVVQTSGITAVHDGVRPLTPLTVIDACFSEAEKTGAAIPVVEVIDSIRQIGKKGSKALKRSKLRAVQTPQVFRNEILLSAYNRKYQEKFTDDASVVEAAGFGISLVAGSLQNIKLTTPFDFKLAELFLEQSPN